MGCGRPAQRQPIAPPGAAPVTRALGATRPARYDAGVTQPQALALSIAIELPVVLGLALGLRWIPRARLRRLLLVGVAATLLTHPFAWHGLPGLREVLPLFWARALLVEGLVAVVEGLLYARLLGLRLARGQALGWAANATSFGLGLLLMRLASR